MDPNFSVLLGDSTSDCNVQLNKGGKKVNKKIIAIVVPILVAAAIIGVILFLAYPR